jgi:transmembrane sensor
MARNGTQDDGSYTAPNQSRALHKALDWFVYLQDPDVSDADLKAFRAWYDADAHHRAAYARVENTWGAPELAGAARAVDEREPPRERRPQRRGAWRAVAVAAVVLLAVIGIGGALDLPLRLQADHMTATGERQEIPLAGDSRVLLDSASAIRTTDTGDTRRVELLAGRGFFDIAPGSDRRFQVVTERAVIEVTGTQFTVASESDGTTVILREGGLSVRQRTTTETGVRLAPGQRITVGANGLSAPENVSFSAASGWIQGRLIFSDRMLSSLLDELRRYHRGTILLLDPDLAEVRLSGNYKFDDPVRVVEQLAGLASGEVVRLSDRVLVVH